MPVTFTTDLSKSFQVWISIFAMENSEHLNRVCVRCIRNVAQLFGKKHIFNISYLITVILMIELAIMKDITIISVFSNCFDCFVSINLYLLVNIQKVFYPFFRNIIFFYLCRERYFLITMAVKLSAEYFTVGAITRHFSHIFTGLHSNLSQVS